MVTTFIFHLTNLYFIQWFSHQEKMSGDVVGRHNQNGGVTGSYRSVGQGGC